MKPRLQLYRRLDAALGDEHEDPRASLVNLVDVMLVFACGLLAALTASQPSALSRPQPVEKGREIAQPEHAPGPGAGYDRVGEVFRDPVSGKLVLIERAADYPGRPIIPPQAMRAGHSGLPMGTPSAMPLAGSLPCFTCKTIKYIGASPVLR